MAEVKIRVNNIASLNAIELELKRAAATVPHQALQVHEYDREECEAIVTLRLPDAGVVVELGSQVSIH